MTKELEALNELRENLDFEGCLDFINEKRINDIKQALQRLEAIDNANPSEALKCFKDIEERCKNDYEDFIVGYDYEKELSTIKQALIKAQEQEKLLEIIKEKRVNILLFLDSLMYSGLEYYNSHMAFIYLKLTQDEFDLLKRWVGNGNQ